MGWTQRLQPLANLLFQTKCPLCDRPTPQVLCLDCDRQLQGDRLTVSLSREARETVPILAWGRYGGTLRRAIAAMKYHHHPELARPLGQYLAHTWRTSPLAARYPSPVVVPVPMHAEKQKERGFNQAELIAKAFCEYAKVPLQTTVVRRTRNTQPLFSLSPAERETTLTDAFSLTSANRLRPPKTVLLIDDIYTTGATLRAIHRAFNQHQITLCGLAVTARGGASPADSATT